MRSGVQGFDRIKENEVDEQAFFWKVGTAAVLAGTLCGVALTAAACAYLLTLAARLRQAIVSAQKQEERMAQINEDGKKMAKDLVARIERRNCRGPEDVKSVPACDADVPPDNEGDRMPFKSGPTKKGL